MEISEINTGTLEGRLLIAALSVISKESRTNQAPYEILNDVLDLSEKIYKDKNKIYAPGAKAKIIGKNGTHTFDIGQEVTLLRFYAWWNQWECKGDNDVKFWVDECDLELI